MWKVQALLVQLLLLACVLQIYFHYGTRDYPVAQMTLPEIGARPPAKRLVVFLTEGVRSDAFFRSNDSHLIFLPELLSYKSRFGVASTSVPTLSRSGKVALFAGFYEKPSLLPQDDFDSICNRVRANSNGTVLDFVSDNQNPLSMLFTTLTSWETVRTLRKATRLMINIHLDGVNAKRPSGKNYRRQFKFEQMLIRGAHDFIERTFKDGRTVYLWTSTYGLSSHGGGSIHETGTPFYIWGAGILPNNVSSSCNGLCMPLHKLDKIQLTPLLSALIGLPPPANNLGLLPLGYIMATKGYERKFMHLNALQLLDQAKEKILKHEEGLLHWWLPKSNDLDLKRISTYQIQMDHLLKMGWRMKARQTSKLAANLALKTIKFYDGYYHIPLLVTTALALLGWMMFLAVRLSGDSLGSNEDRVGHFTFPTILLASLGIMFGQIVSLQWPPILTVVCLLVPFGIWCLALAGLPAKGCVILGPLTHFLWIFGAAGSIVLAFKGSSFLSLIFAACVIVRNRYGWLHITAQFLAWMAIVCLLTGFLMSQPVIMILMAPVCRIPLQAISLVLTILRPCLLKHKIPTTAWYINLVILLIAGVGIFYDELGNPIPIVVVVAHWIYLLYAFGSLTFWESSSPENRWELISFNLLTVHALLSDSYSSLFAQLLVTEYQMGMDIYMVTKDECDGAKPPKTNTVKAPSKHLLRSYRYAGAILLYAFVSFWGCGHWMDGVTYFGNTARLFCRSQCLVPMVLLVLIHMLIPAVVILARMQAMSSFALNEMRPIFACIMLICNAVILFYVVFIDVRAIWPAVHPSVINTTLTLLVIIFLLISDSLVKLLFLSFKQKSLTLTISPEPDQHNNHLLSTSDV
ncbi:hypothetical protein KR018_010997 [Drosophila ironensis]|nr:hypothetical protein KR018_010997 [Drosophila ironensis]